MQCRVQDPLLGRLSHKFADKLTKSCRHKCLKVAEKFLFLLLLLLLLLYYYYYLFAFEVDFIAVSIVHSITRFYSYFLFFLTKLHWLIELKFNSWIDRPFICTFFPAEHCVRHFEKRIMWYRLPHGQSCNTKLALVIGPVLESTHSLSGINQLNLADVFSIANKCIK